jgi:plasmid stabilization system protein ParE
MNFRFLFGFRHDADEAEARLEFEHVGYGLAFAEELATGIGAVLAQPRLYSPTTDGPARYETREFFISRLNYRMIYAIVNNELVFVAVIHARRRPRSWVRRLRELN